MTHRFNILPVVLLAGAFLLFGCDQSSQNIDFSSGDSYIVNFQNSANGDAEKTSVTVPDTVNYSVQAFTIEKDYTWTVNGTELPVETRADQSYVWERRDGEFISVVFSPEDPVTSANSETTTHTITVDASPDDIEADTFEVEAQYPTIGEQAGRLGSSFATLGSLASSSGIAEVLTGGGPFTLLGPLDSALSGLDPVPTQATDDDEPATSSVLGDILKYHAVDAAVASGDISDGQTATTLLGNQTVTFSVSGGNISVEGAQVVRPDIPVTNGSFHGIDALITPSTASVDFTDRTPSDSALTRTGADTELAAGDSLTVDGSFFPAGGGFVVLHDSTSLADDGAIPSIVGSSEYVDPGVQNEIRVELDEAVSDTTTIGAMAHEDTDGDQQYDFETSVGAEDTPYTLDGAAVIDYADILIPQ